MTGREQLEAAMAERQKASQAARSSHNEIFTRALDAVESSSAQFQTVVDLFRDMDKRKQQEKEQ